jgi:Cytochrome bd terminal oxidase subunit I
MGVVSGIVLSYQFGTNWSRFSVVVGNVIGPLIGYRILSRGDVSRHHAVRLEARVAMVAYAFCHSRCGRYPDVGLLHPVGKQLDADTGRICHA